MSNWYENIEAQKNVLGAISVFDTQSKEVEVDSAFQKWRDWVLQIRKNKNILYLVGNGASASMASHMAADLAKNAHIHTEVFYDLSLITAVANDISYEDVFAEPLRRRMRKGDMLVAISSSGNSPNIICAINAAKKMDGKVITLSAMKGDNKMRSMGDLNFYIPGMTYGMAESCHASILHYWMDIVAEG